MRFGGERHPLHGDPIHALDVVQPRKAVVEIRVPGRHEFAHGLVAGHEVGEEEPRLVEHRLPQQDVPGRPKEAGKKLGEQLLVGRRGVDVFEFKPLVEEVVDEGPRPG